MGIELRSQILLRISVENGCYLDKMLQHISALMSEQQKNDTE